MTENLEAKIKTYSHIFHQVIGNSEAQRTMFEFAIDFSQKWGVDLDYVMGLSMGFVNNGNYDIELFNICEKHDNFNFYHGMEISQFQDYEKFFSEISNEELEAELHNHYISCMQQEKSNPDILVKGYLIEGVCFGCDEIRPKDIVAWEVEGDYFAMYKTLAEKLKIDSGKKARKKFKTDSSSGSGFNWDIKSFMRNSGSDINIYVCYEDINKRFSLKEYGKELSLIPPLDTLYDDLPWAG